MRKVRRIREKCFCTYCHKRQFRGFDRTWLNPKLSCEHLYEVINDKGFFWFYFSNDTNLTAAMRFER